MAEKNVSLLEGYLLAEDSDLFLRNQVKLPHEKQLFSLLLDPSSESDVDNAKKIGLSEKASD